jgi:hypothetical protein
MVCPLYQGTFHFNPHNLLHRSIVESHIESRRETVRKVLLASLEREMTCSLVYGRSEYFHYKNAYLDLYRSQHPAVTSNRGFPTAEIIHAVADVVPDPVISVVGHSMANLVGKIETDEDGLRDEEEHGIRIMAEARAFYHGE